MTNPKHEHDQPIISNGVNHTVAAYANPIEILFPAKFFDSLGTRFKPQGLDVSRDALPGLPGKVGKLLERRWSDLNLIPGFRSCRHLSEP